MRERATQIVEQGYQATKWFFRHDPTEGGEGKRQNLALIRAVQIFDVVFAFTGGGPGTATLYLVQYIYDNGFASPSKQYGLASGASLLMAGVLIVFTLIQLRFRKEEF